jgi:hypothetical protein
MDPLKLTEVGSVTDDEFVSRQQHLEVAHAQFSLEGSSLCRITLVRDHLHGRRPLGKLALPVGHGSQGNDDEVGAALTLDFN